MGTRVKTGIYGRMMTRACVRGVRGLIWSKFISLLIYYEEEIVNIPAPGQEVRQPTAAQSSLTRMNSYHQVVLVGLDPISCLMIHSTFPLRFSIPASSSCSWGLHLHLGAMRSAIHRIHQRLWDSLQRGTNTRTLI